MTATPFMPHLGRQPRALSKDSRRTTRTAKVTPTGVRFLLLTLAVGLAAVNTGNNILYLLFAMMLSLIVVAGLFSERVLSRLGATRSLPLRVFADTPTPYQMVLTNGKRFMPSFSLRIREGQTALRLDATEQRCPRLEPTGTVTIDAVVTFRDRGVHHLPRIEVTTTFPFSLFEKTLRIPVDSDLLVYPSVKPSGALSPRLSLEEGPSGNLRGTAGVSHVREYRTGDDPRFIHWKHSARRAQLVIREPELEGARSLTLVFSNRLPPDPLPIHREWFEEAVRLAASLADRAIREGREVLMATWDGTTRMGRGAIHLERMLRMLATIAPAAPAGDRLVAWAADLAHQPVHLILVWDDPRWSVVRPRCERVWIVAQDVGRKAS